MDNPIENKDELFVENLREVLDRREIYAVIFDVDNTLFDTTNGYYYRETTALSLLLASQINEDKEPQEVADLIQTLLKGSYANRRNRKPVLVQDWYLGVLHKHLNGNISDEMKHKVEEHFKDFYEVVPPLYPSVPRILKTFLKIDREIGLYSNAQLDWTAKKADSVSKLIVYNIPYIATPIDKEKDEHGWSKAFAMMNINPENILVVGDNLHADILPAIEAGCRNVVWIKRYDEVLPDHFNENGEINLSVIGDIGELLDTFQ